MTYHFDYPGDIELLNRTLGYFANKPEKLSSVIKELTVNNLYGKNYDGISYLQQIILYISLNNLDEVFNYDFIDPSKAERFNEVFGHFANNPSQLLSVIKLLAVKHLYCENYEEISRFIDENVLIYYGDSHIKYIISDKNLEELKSMLHKEFPRGVGVDVDKHSVFQSLYLCFVLDQIGINRGNFPQEE